MAGFFERLLSPKNGDEDIHEQAKYALSQLTKKEINRKAEQYKKKATITHMIFAIILGAVFLAFICCLIVVSKNEPIEPIFIVLVIVVGIFVTSTILIDLFLICRKPTKELALLQIKKDISNGISFTDSSYIDEDFDITKTIVFMTQGQPSKLLIDFDNQKFVYQKGEKFSKTYDFADMISYEIYENGESQVQGRAGAALIGGAFFGLSGAIAGSSMSRNISKKCTQLKLLVRLNDFDRPQITITYVDNESLNKSEMTYKKMLENLQSACSMLEYIINSKTYAQDTNDTPSQKKQLQELKEMLEIGLITQEDFDAKKKQILGL